MSSSNRRSQPWIKPANTRRLTLCVKSLQNKSRNKVELAEFPRCRRCPHENQLVKREVRRLRLCWTALALWSAPRFEITTQNRSLCQQSELQQLGCGLTGVRLS